MLPVIALSVELLLARTVRAEQRHDRARGHVVETSRTAASLP
ncbi:hypothetical protein [Pseudonocardia sp. ICBG601]|nr:hypothetical protein [Pseudonocardia sp. ICBG601]